MKIKQLKDALHINATHPLNRGKRISSFLRFAAFQVRGWFIEGTYTIEFVNNTQINIQRGDSSALALLTGLYEFEEMAFLLHFLREEDLFVDVGANIGAFSILASGVIGSPSIAFEPVPVTVALLENNVMINRLASKVTVINAAVGSKEGAIPFTSTFGAMNHAATDNEKEQGNFIEVPIMRLDDLDSSKIPTLIKIDVEGFEPEVIAGARSILKNPKVQALIVETNGSGKRYGYNDEDLHKTILGFGFSSIAYNPELRKIFSLNNEMNKSSGNTIYIRDKNIVQERVSQSPCFLVRHNNVMI